MRSLGTADAVFRSSARTTGSKTAHVQAPHTQAAAPAGIVRVAAVRPKMPDTGDT